MVVFDWEYALLPLDTLASILDATATLYCRQAARADWSITDVLCHVMFSARHVAFVQPLRRHLATVMSTVSLSSRASALQHVCMYIGQARAHGELLCG